MTTLRRMTKADATATARLLANSWRQTYEHLMGMEQIERANARHDADVLASELDDDDVMSFVAVDESGEVVGHAMARMDDRHHVWLERLHVAPGRFGTGLAADMLHVVLAAHVGLPSIALEVVAGNARAVGFYEKHGFVVAERKDSCGSVDGVPTLVMRKALPRA